ncbi:protein kinase [Nonomuraea sp. NPDC047897]|uniref:protein kinase domain-containing protein n=1 Tax=Nonomuraea sp. NPDC047897 TaxID=3364346 RepID=UPI003720E517
MEQEGTSRMEPTGAAPLRPTDLREIGPYRLLGRLGEGGMGTVFLAKAPTARFVAVKVVKAEFANQEGFAARFHAEVENARRVASFCTAQVLDNGNTADGRPFMVTEYIAGIPLSAQISRYGALDPGPLHGVALGVTAALAAIHVAGLVHRDLKPANVILSLSGPRVIDFGIARALDRETGFTLSGELIGSPGWWAPEQVRGESVTPAADIFAWGCLVAYAGNGRHPFGRGDVITLASRVLHTTPDLGELPTPLNELVRLATSMDPAERPTAQDLVIALVGGAAPARTIAADPPTLVAPDLMDEWEPPRNVVDEPDITATFATPPPADTMADGSGAGRAGTRPETAGPSATAGTRPGAAGTSAIAPSTLFDEDATDPGVSATVVSGEGTADSTDATTRDGPSHQEDPVMRAKPARGGTEPARGGAEPARRRPQRTRGTRWLIAAAAAVLAIAVTAGTLIITSGRDGTPGSGARTVSPAAQQPNDVGRRFALGPSFDDPQLIFASAPRCGLKEYEGRQQSQGQLCTVRWSVVNPGGARRNLGDLAVSLQDDRGARHEPAPVTMPAAIAPGARLDGVFVFDLPLYRRPVRLTLRVQGGEEVQVRLG